jgi:hypothetical protein
MNRALIGLCIVLVWFLTACQKPVNPPSISSFTATPSSLPSSGNVKLEWDVSGATNLSIAPNPGAVSGSSTTVNVTATTTFTLSASNPSGATTAQATVTVGQTSGNGVWDSSNWDAANWQ